MERRMDFVDHRRELESNRYVYAVVSRRARGLSIGVNLNPDKVCNFDCPYCQVDRTAGMGGDGRVVVEEVGRELGWLLGKARGELWAGAPFDTVEPALRRVADIAFAGDGEPTSAAGFAAAARIAREVRDQHGLAVPLRLLTNATLLHRERVQEGLQWFDELWCKLDAGTEAYFRLVDGTTLPFARVLKNLEMTAQRRAITIQSMFMRYDGAGPTDAEIAAWGGRLAAILAAGGQITEVQVYSVARKPSDPRVEPLDRARLEQIAAAVPAGVRVSVHG